MQLACPGLRVALLLEFLFYVSLVLLRLACHMLQLHLAHHYWHSCPLEPRIPIWNLIDAIFGISFLVMEMMEKLILLPDVLAKLQFRGIRVKTHSVKTVSTGIRGFCAVFLCLWFFTGNLWVFPITDQVLHPKNISNDVNEVDAMRTQVYIIDDSQEPKNSLLVNEESHNPFELSSFWDAVSSTRDFMSMATTNMQKANSLSGIKYSSESPTNHIVSTIKSRSHQTFLSPLESTANHVQSSTVTSSTSQWFGSTSSTLQPEAETCNKTLFLATFWILIGSYIVVGTIFLAAFLLACCAEPFQKLYRLLRALWRVFYHWFDANCLQTERNDYEQLL